jgi:hypothetical protein
VIEASGKESIYTIGYLYVALKRSRTYWNESCFGLLGFQTDYNFKLMFGIIDCSVLD